jgi:acetyl-CoA carboxylase biotin carboxyl carrier protein
MNLDEIKELIAVMRKNRIKEIDLEQKGVKVRIVSGEADRGKPMSEMMMAPQLAAPSYLMPPVATHSAMVGSIPPASFVEVPSAGPQAVPEKVSEAEIKGVEIKSPMVGTFYRAPAPDAPNYVEEGAVINNESVLCIVEAMKLMNEIKAEMRGKVLRALVTNGQPVEYNQPLFLVEPF